MAAQEKTAVELTVGGEPSNPRVPPPEQFYRTGSGLQKKSAVSAFIPGQRLWSQIGGVITDPAECDAWAIILMPNSIQSQPCIEELSYALDRLGGT